MNNCKSIRLEGIQTLGPVNRLPAYDKKRHTLPAESNDYTRAFLARLIEDLLIGMVEERFKVLRQSLQYKRREISATCQTPAALIQTKDFDYELQYDLDPDSPHFYRLQQSLINLTNTELLQIDAFNLQFVETFDAVIIDFLDTINIESIIDAFEEDNNPAWSLDYPPDCSYCKVVVPDTAVEIHFTHNHLKFQFSHKQSPRELHQNCQELRNQLAAVQGLAFLSEP